MTKLHNFPENDVSLHKFVTDESEAYSNKGL